MITLKNTPQDNIVAYEIDGEIDKAGINEVFAAVQEKIERLGKIRLYAEIKSIGGWKSFEDFSEMLKDKIGMVGSIGKVEKYAIVSDKSWIKAYGKFSDFVMPTMDIKVFEPMDNALAMTWLELPTREELHGLQVIDLDEPHLLSFAIDGRLTKADMDLVNRKIEMQLLKQPKIKMYIEFINLSGMSLQAVWEDLKAEFKYYGKFEKVAILAENSWMETFTKFTNFMNSKIEIKHFKPAQSEAAIDWLKN